MSKVMRVVFLVYGILFVLIMVGALISVFGGFAHDYMDPGM